MFSNKILDTHFYCVKHWLAAFGFGENSESLNFVESLIYVRYIVFNKYLKD